MKKNFVRKEILLFKHVTLKLIFIVYVILLEITQQVTTKIYPEKITEWVKKKKYFRLIY